MGISGIFEHLKRIFGFADDSHKRLQAKRQREEDSELFESPNSKQRRLSSDWRSLEDISDIFSDSIDVERTNRNATMQRTAKQPQTSSRQGSPRICPQRRTNCALQIQPTLKNPTPRTQLFSYKKSSNGPLLTNGVEKVNNYQQIEPECSYKTSQLTRSQSLRDKERYSEMLKNFSTPSSSCKQRLQNGGAINQPHKLQHTVGSQRRSPETIKLPATPQAPFFSYFNSTTRRKPDSSLSDFRAKDERGSLSSFSRIQIEKEKECRGANGYAAAARRAMPPPSCRINSMQERLAAKSVTKSDFIKKTSNAYDQRQVELDREIEEMRKMQLTKQQMSQSIRTNYLAQSLHKTLRISVEVLDEVEPIVEEYTPPELTREMMKAINNALVPSPQGQVLVESFGLRITRKDIATLGGLNWLNDEVINFYMNLLMERGKLDNFPKVYAMNTFFYPKLQSGGHSSLKRWTRKVDIFSMDLVVIPIHLGIHWCMSIIDFRDKIIR